MMLPIMIATRFIIVADTRKANVPAETVLRGLLETMNHQYGARCVECRMDEVAVRRGAGLGSSTKPESEVIEG